MLSVFTRSDPEAIRDTMRRMTKVFNNCIACEGMVNLCKRIKESEKLFLLTRSSSWFSKRLFQRRGISEECVKVFFTVHRNMKVPPKPNYSSIRHIGATMDSFFSNPNFEMAFDIASKQRNFRVPTREDYFRHAYAKNFTCATGRCHW